MTLVHSWGHNSHDLITPLKAPRLNTITWRIKFQYMNFGCVLHSKHNTPKFQFYVIWPKQYCLTVHAIPDSLDKYFEFNIRIWKCATSNLSFIPKIGYRYHINFVFKQEFNLPFKKWVFKTHYITVVSILPICLYVSVEMGVFLFPFCF